MNQAESYNRVLDMLREMYDDVSRLAAQNGVEVVIARHPAMQFSQPCRRTKCAQEMKGQPGKLIRMISGGEGWVHELCP